MTEWKVPVGSTVHIDTAGSPRWLTVTRDVLLSLAALLFIIGALYVAVAAARVGSAIDEIGSPTESTSPEPCYITGDPTCVQPGD